MEINTDIGIALKFARIGRVEQIRFKIDSADDNPRRPRRARQPAGQRSRYDQRNGNRKCRAV